MKTRLKILFRRIRILPRCVMRSVKLKYELFVLERSLSQLLSQQRYVNASMTCLAFEGMLVDIHAERDQITIDPKTQEVFNREVDFQTANDVIICDQIERTRRMIDKHSFELGKLDEVVPHLFVH